MVSATDLRLQISGSCGPAANSGFDDVRRSGMAMRSDRFVHRDGEKIGGWDPVSGIYEAKGDVGFFIVTIPITGRGRWNSSVPSGIFARRLPEWTQ